MTAVDPTLFPGAPASTWSARTRRIAMDATARKCASLAHSACCADILKNVSCTNAVGWSVIGSDPRSIPAAIRRSSS